MAIKYLFFTKKKTPDNIFIMLFAGTKYDFFIFCGKKQAILAVF
jgi:hypothetical protein